jgi:hypothetical protein
MITSEQEAGNRSQVPWMSSRHGLSSVHWRVAFRLAGEMGRRTVKLSRRRGEVPETSTTTDAKPGPCGAWREGSRSTGCKDEVFLLQPPGLLRGSRVLYVPSGRSFCLGRDPARTPDEMPLHLW